ncbi:ATP-binding protein [Croceibacterium ferulae]|uniref:ATP-binding protein n=1 Tax=Croceibacterium ferulae TaxID=1854641 RepID=UPI000EB2B1B0|nr:ATP-binding protein [Croceibacterium ferulae]
MSRVRLWPGSLTGRVTLVLLVAILVEFGGTVLVFGEAERLLLRTGQAQRVAEQVVAAEQVLGQLPPDRRREIAPGLSTRHVVFAASDTPPPAGRQSDITRAARAAMLQWEPALEEDALRVGLSGRSFGTQRLQGGIRTGDGGWILFRLREPVSHWHASLQWLASLVFLAGAVLLAAVLLVRTMAAPLRALADAADRIGIGRQPILIEPGGPQEMRRLAEAFNAMQARIGELIDSRTEALLAVSHDLRTPLSRLKLRLHGRLRDGDQEALQADVAEMQDMLDSLLAYLADGAEGGERVRTDLAALVNSVVHNAHAVGAEVALATELTQIHAVVDAGAIRRAVTNLVENALRHAGDATVSLSADAEQVTITVRDHGPGIPEAQLAQVIVPFFRGDSARARDTTGMGMGLAVADRVAQQHGGRLHLANADPGLRAELILPLVH